MSRENQSKKANFKKTEALVIPEQIYYSIGDVARFLQVKTHVLRYWEHHIADLDPIKRQGRRYYDKSHIALLKKIRFWLYELGYTVEGVKKKLSDNEKSIDSHRAMELIAGIESLASQLMTNDDQLLNLLASE